MAKQDQQVLMAQKGPARARPRPGPRHRFQGRSGRPGRRRQLGRGPAPGRGGQHVRHSGRLGQRSGQPHHFLQDPAGRGPAGQARRRHGQGEDRRARRTPTRSSASAATRIGRLARSGDGGFFQRPHRRVSSLRCRSGPSSVLCFRRVLTAGRLVGLFTVLGAAAADTIYGLIAATGISRRSPHTVLTHREPLRIFGGPFLLYLGVSMRRANPAAEQADERSLTRACPRPSSRPSA